MLIESTTEYAIEFVKGKRALDVGCIGTMLEEQPKMFCARHKRLSETADELFGIDINEEGIRRANEEGLSKIHLCNVCHVFHVQYFLMHHSDEEKFDVITCMDCIEHLMNVGNFLENMKMLLKPGGKLFIATANMFSVRYWLKKLEGSLVISDEHVAWYCEKTLWQVCEQAGYSIEHVFFSNDGKSTDDEAYLIADYGFEEWMSKRVCIVVEAKETIPRWAVCDTRPNLVKV